MACAKDKQDTECTCVAVVYIAFSIWSAQQSCCACGYKNMHTMHGVFVVMLRCFSIRASAAGMV